MSAPILFFRRRINTATTLYFPITLPTTTNAPASTFVSRGVAAPTLAAGDCKISIDGGAAANTTNLPAPTTGAGGYHSLTLTAAETNGSVINIRLVDQTATFEWEDIFIIIETSLQLGSVVVNNPSGDAISATSSGSNGAGFSGTAHGSGVGIKGSAGTGAGYGIAGIASSGAGGAAIYAKGANGGTNTPGIYCDAQGSGSGIDSNGGTAGHGIKGVGQGAAHGFSGTGGVTGYNSNFFDDLEGSEPIAAPNSNSSFRNILQYLKRRLYNKVTQSSTQQLIYRDDSSTVCSTQPVSDDGVLQTKGKAS